MKVNLNRLLVYLSGHDEVDAVLVRLLGVCAEPEPLHSALARLLALCAEVGGHGDTELSVVQGQLSEVLVGVRSKRDERWTDKSVRRQVDNRHVARAFVGNRELGSKGDLFSGGKRLDIVLVVLELDTFAEENVAVRRAVAGNVLEWAGLIRGESRDGLGAADLLRDGAGKAHRRRDNVAVRERCGSEEGGCEERGGTHFDGVLLSYCWGILNKRKAKNKIKGRN